MILRTVYKPSDFWPAGAASGIEYQTQVTGSVTYLDNHFSSEAEANAAFPYIARSSGAWDPLELGDTWADWSMDSACIMEAFEHAAEQTAYWENGIQPGVVEFDPGVYHVSMGHVWFYSAVYLKGAEHCRFDGCMNDKRIFFDSGKSSSWWNADSARAVLTVGTDTSHRRWLYSGQMWDLTNEAYSAVAFRGFSLNLPRVNNYENSYSGIGYASGAGIRLLSHHDMTVRDIAISGPFRYGLIFCNESGGNAFNHYYLNIVHGCLVALKWRSRAFNNDCNMYCGSFTQRASPLTYFDLDNNGYNPNDYPTVVFDADNTIENPNDIYDPTSNTRTPGHWEFMNVSCEVNATQFIRASGIYQWHFHNARWEAMDRPVMGASGFFDASSNTVGYYQWPRQEWFLKDVQFCSANGGSSQFMMHGIPSGVLGHGFTLHNSYNAPSFKSQRNYTAGSDNSYRMARHMYEDLVLDGQHASIIMDSYDGNNRYRIGLADTPFSSNGDYQIVARPLPKTGLSWRNYDALGGPGNYSQDVIYMSSGERLQIKHHSTNCDTLAVYARNQYPNETSSGPGQIVYAWGDFDANGELKVDSMVPFTVRGWYLLYIVASKYVDGTYTFDKDAGKDYVRYPLVVFVT